MKRSTDKKRREANVKQLKDWRLYWEKYRDPRTIPIPHPTSEDIQKTWDHWEQNGTVRVLVKNGKRCLMAR
jgi:hypothetical protein